MGLSHHQLVISDLLEGTLIWGSSAEFAACLDRGFEPSHRPQDLTLGAANAFAPRCNKKGILHSEISRVKVGDRINRPMVQHTGHNCKREIGLSLGIVTIEVDRPLPDRAGGFIVLPRRYLGPFGDAGQFCRCFDIRSGPFGLGGSREVAPCQNPET